MVHICMNFIDCDEAQIDKFSSEDEDKDVYYLEEVQNILVNNIYLNPIIIKKNIKNLKLCRLHFMENIFLKE